MPRYKEPIASPQAKANSSAKIVRDRLMEILFEPEKRRFKHNIDRIIDKNCEITGRHHNIFFYDGKQYYRSNADNNKSSSGLHPSLYPDMEDHIASFKRVEEDKEAIAQVLFFIIDRSKNTQMLRNSFPEFMIESFDDKIKSLPRTDEPGCSIRDEEKNYKLFLEYLPKMEVYYISRMLY